MRKLLPVLLLSMPSVVNAGCIDLCNNLSKVEQWQHYLEKNGQTAKIILDIHNLRENRDLPNSMARLAGPDDSAKPVLLKISNLQNLNKCKVRKVLSCLFLQNYDESLTRTAIEISLRLSDNSLNEWIGKLPKEKRQARLNLIEEITENIHLDSSRFKP